MWVNIWLFNFFCDAEPFSYRPWEYTSIDLDEEEEDAEAEEDDEMEEEEVRMLSRMIWRRGGGVWMEGWEDSNLSVNSDFLSQPGQENQPLFCAHI